MRSKGKWELIILGLGRFGADLLGAEAGVGGLNFPRGSLAQRVDQLVEEVRDTSGRFTGQLLADGANDDVDPWRLGIRSEHHGDPRSGSWARGCLL